MEKVENLKGFYRNVSAFAQQHLLHSCILVWLSHNRRKTNLCPFISWNIEKWQNKKNKKAILIYFPEACQQVGTDQGLIFNLMIW